MPRSRFKAKLHEYPIQLGTHEVFDLNKGIWTPISPFTYINPSRVYEGLAGCRDFLHHGPPYNSGGPLDILHYYDTGLYPRNYGVYHGYIGGVKRYRYTGGFVCSWYPTGGDGGDPPFTQLNLRTEAETFKSPLSGYWDTLSYGAKAWNKFRLGKPSANMGVFLGELRDVPGMLKGAAEHFHDLWRSLGGSLHGFYPKAVADKWLSLNFGWLPFVNDLRAFHRTTQNLDLILTRIRNQNGKWIRRSGTVDETTRTDVIAESGSLTLHRPVLPSWYYRGSTAGSYRIVRKFTRKVWFEGRFRFYVPDIGTAEWGKRATRQIYGLQPTPSMIYQLMPWSWLFDWCSNMGSVISNLSDGWAENQAAKYAYVMDTTDYEYEANSFHNLIEGPIHDTWVFPVTRKARVEACPFGFSPTSWDNLSVRQWSLLSALGLQKFSRV